MTREQQIIEAFVELADTTVEKFNLIDFLRGLAARCVELLECAEAGLLIADVAGKLQVMASSSERFDALDLLQAQQAEGPSYECYFRGQSVLSENLAADGGRWPAFTPLALAQGFCSIQAFPMRVRGQTIGALNLFREEPGRIPAADLTLGQAIADIAAIAILQERSVRESHRIAAQLQGALNSRVTIEQAKGILAERAHIGLDTAFARLRTHARTTNARLGDIANDLINGHLDTTRLTTLPPSTPGPDRSAHP